MNKAAGGDELAELFSLIPDLPQVTNTSGNASLQLQDLSWELGLELPAGAAPGHPPGGGGAESADTEARVRTLISVVYWVLCALGLTGNLLVLYLMKSKQGWRQSSINLFVTNLALTDFQFVLTLPFWAVENSLDFRWPSGKATCKIVSTVTSMNIHRTRGHGRGDCCGRSLGDSCRFSAKVLCVLIWASAALPKAIFSTTIEVMGEELCLVRFPGKLLGRDRQFRLGLHHVQKSILIELNAVPFSQEYFLCQVYAFPVSVCLAHSNSRLNPILYCLVRRDMRPFAAATKPEPEAQGRQALAPLHQAAEPDMLYYPPGVVVYSGGRYDLLPSSSAY
ncbi:Relaxin-3 receptor 1, partial [Eschrichtius robustus]|nr:Relaxin-3 receptor 1 [Eschrichtius robustus]